MAHFFRRHKFARMSSEVNSEIDYKDQDRSEPRNWH